MQQAKATLKKQSESAHSLFADFFVLGVLFVLVFSVSTFVRFWSEASPSSFTVSTDLVSLAQYTGLSLLRGSLALILSLVFALIYGYGAAKVPVLERVLIPLLDLLQSIPVLGFLPGLVLGLVALFPGSNLGVEIACLLMIFSGQVWNLIYSIYSSLKSMPNDLKEMADVTGLSPWQRWKYVELPFSSVGLVWNSVLSMAGGWFFLTICESFQLGDRKFQLPGIGSYMALAMEKGDFRLILQGLLAMTVILLFMDLILWRPLLSWIMRFRYDTEEGQQGDSVAPSTILALYEDSKVLEIFRSWFQSLWASKWVSKFVSIMEKNLGYFLDAASRFLRAIKPSRDQAALRWDDRRLPKRRSFQWGHGLMVLLSLIMVVWLGHMVLDVLTLSWAEWWDLSKRALMTLSRVFACLILGTIWTLPLGVWVGAHPRWTAKLQPVFQFCASFPAPMLYPLVFQVLSPMGMSLNMISIVLMMLGSQWYILFNVISGAMNLSRDLRLSLELMGVSYRTLWLRLYIPGVFPSLVVGWVTAAGGAWNASILTEFMTFKSQHIQAYGLGASISQAAHEGQISKMAGALVVLVVLVLVLNLFVWQKIISYVTRRYRLA